jgi:hypothetical protein
MNEDVDIEVVESEVFVSEGAAKNGNAEARKLLVQMLLGFAAIQVPCVTKFA